MSIAAVAPNASDIRSGAHKWYIAATLCAAHAVSLVDRFIMVLVAEPVRHALALSDTQLGLLQGTGFAILYCAFAIPLGWAADVTNRRNLIIAGLTLWSGATAAAAFANSFEMLFLVRLLVGFGEACLIPAGMSLLVAYFPAAQLGRGVSIFGVGVNIGLGIAFIGGGALLGLLDTNGGLAFGGAMLAPWQAVFLLSGLTSAPVLLMLLWVREPARQTSTGGYAATIAGLRDAASHLWRNMSAYGPFFIVGSCTATMGYATTSWSSSVLVRIHEQQPADAGMLVGVVSVVGGSLGTLTGGWLLDVLTMRRVVGAPLVFMAGAALVCLAAVVGFCTAPTLMLAAASLFVFCFGTTGALPGLYVGMQTLTPDRFRGVAASLNMMIYTLLGLGVGPAAVGMLSDRMGAEPSALAAALLITEAVLAVIVVVVALAARRAFQAKALS